MTHFLDLPIELLPAILRHIINPHQLALCCLVNKTFSLFAIPQLYECIYIYAWHRHAKFKVGKMKLNYIPSWNATDSPVARLSTFSERLQSVQTWLKGSKS